jgi:hypothetical protein
MTIGFVQYDLKRQCGCIARQPRSHAYLARLFAVIISKWPDEQWPEFTHDLDLYASPAYYAFL